MAAVPLRPEGLTDVADWVGQYRRHREESFERLDEYLKTLEDEQAEGAGDDDDRDAHRPG